MLKKLPRRPLIILSPWPQQRPLFLHQFLRLATGMTPTPTPRADNIPAYRVVDIFHRQLRPQVPFMLASMSGQQQIILTARIRKHILCRLQGLRLHYV